MDRVRIRVATVDDIPDGAGVSPLRHEHFGRVVLDLVLAVDDGAADGVPGQGDDAVDERELAGRVAGRAHEEVLVPAAPVPEVQEVVVDIGVRGILQLDGEGLDDAVRQADAWDDTGCGDCAQDTQQGEIHDDSCTG